MKQVKLASVLAIAILSAGTISGCGVDRPLTQEPPVETSEATPTVSPQVQQAWEKVKVSGGQLSVAIDNLDTQLRAAIVTQNNSNIDFQTPGDRVEEFRFAIQEFIPKLDASSSPQLAQLSENLQTISAELDAVIDPLQNNFDPETVGEVQDILRVQYGNNRGVFGNTTKETLAKYVVEKRDRLKEGIASIESAIEPTQTAVAPATSNNVGTGDNNSALSALNAENQKLREDLTRYYSELTQLSRSYQELRQSVFLLSIVTVVAFLGAAIAGLWFFWSKCRQASESEELEDFDVADSDQLKQFLGQLHREVHRLSNNQNDIQRHQDKIDLEYNHIIGQLEQRQGSDPSPVPVPTPRDDRPRTQPQLSGSPDDQLLYLYNNNPQEIGKAAIGVAETKDSVELRRAGRSRNAIFKQDRRGDYWIVEMSGHSYLVPQGNPKINEHKVQAMEGSFDCYGYQTGISSRLSLAKPAVVIPIVQGREWELRERGALHFS